MVKILIVSFVLISALGVGLLAAFSVDTNPDLPLPEAHVGLLDAEMDRLGAAWAVFDADAGAWVLQDDMRRELSRIRQLEIAGALIAAELDRLLRIGETGEQRCRVCGCTDSDCSGCIERTGSPCSWVEDDLCSACAGGVM